MLAPRVPLDLEAPRRDPALGGGVEPSAGSFSRRAPTATRGGWLDGRRGAAGSDSSGPRRNRPSRTDNAGAMIGAQHVARPRVGQCTSHVLDAALPYMGVGGPVRQHNAGAGVAHVVRRAMWPEWTEAPAFCSVLRLAGRSPEASMTGAHVP